MNLQDNFLNVARKEGAELIFSLVNGASFRGIVKGFDNFTVIVSSNGKQNLIYKHAISHIESVNSNPKLEIKPFPPTNRRFQPDRTQPDRPQPKEKEKEPPKDKFNSIDLSNVKIKPK